MNGLLILTPVLLFIGFLIACVFNAFLWRWMTDTLTEHVGDYTQWIREKFAACGYYASSTLLGGLFYFGLFLPTVFAPPAGHVAPTVQAPPAVSGTPMLRQSTLPQTQATSSCQPDWVCKGLNVQIK